jgi:sterol desaturase/sphingolipid hydroxylase (fatty acid hydroxylase superfamily)
VIAAVLGVLTWTLLEYAMHRWLGHKFKRNPFGVEHVRHHVEGNYFAPSWKKVIFAALIATGLGLTVGLAFAAGLIGTYAAYEVLHRLEHTHAGIGPYGRWARRHHFHHHFVDGRKNHGVTSPIWDFVFGTYEAPSMIRVPRKLCMPWLLDPTTGDIRATHSSTYQLR